MRWAAAQLVREMDAVHVRRCTSVASAVVCCADAVSCGVPPCRLVRMLRVLTVGDGNLSFSLALLRLHLPSRRERRRRQQLTLSTSSSSSSRLPQPSSPCASPEAASSPPVHVRLPPPLPPLLLTASVFDSEAAVLRRYPEAQAVLTELRRKGAEVLFNVDATHLHTTLQQERRRQCAEAQGYTTAAAEEEEEEGCGDERGAAVWDAVLFLHPHSGRECVRYHRCLLSHFFHSSLQVTHTRSCLAVALCQQQPRAWQVEHRSRQWGWRVQRRWRWEEDLARWNALGYSERRHHNGRSFTQRAGPQRHLLALTREAADDSSSSSEAYQCLTHHSAHLKLLYPHAPAGDERKDLERPATEQPTGDGEGEDDAGGEEVEDEEAEGELHAAAASSAVALFAADCCAVCGESWASAVHPPPPTPSAAAPLFPPSVSLPPADPAAASLRCPTCFILFVNARALRQHEEGWKGREQLHAQLRREEGEGRKRRQSKLMQLGHSAATAAIQRRRERKQQQREHRCAPHTPDASRLLPASSADTAPQAAPPLTATPHT